jgi:hypothetical protein
MGGWGVEGELRGDERRNTTERKRITGKYIDATVIGKIPGKDMQGPDTQATV